VRRGVSIRYFKQFWNLFKKNPNQFNYRKSFSQLPFLKVKSCVFHEGAVVAQMLGKLCVRRKQKKRQTLKQHMDKVMAKERKKKSK